ncbi:MAG TPA: hypothetical protein VFB43_21985 [Terracidiphilus sp.]|nr:hypothetical protein [Terracidiphilus sp.]
MGPVSATIPPELIGATPRNVRITGNGILNACMSALFLAAAVGLFYWLGNQGIRTMQKRAALRANSLVATGVVTELTYIGTRSHTPHARYTFAVDGTSYMGESNVPSRLQSSFQQFRQVPIRYLPTNPAINHPADWEDSTSSAWAPLLVPIILVPSGILMLSTQRRQKKLLTEGTPGAGVVTACTRVKGGYNLKYEFTTAGGQSIAGRSSRSNSQEVGASVCILYMPQQPDRNVLYPSDYYRIAD